MEKDEKNIENIEELTDFEETSADITTESMFSDEIAQDEAIEEDSSLFNQEDEISEETQKEAEKDTEEENKEIEEEIEENTSFLTQNNDITEITEQEPTTIIEEYKPQESYVSTVDDFEEEIDKITAKFQDQLDELTAWETQLDAQITTNSAELEEVNAYLESYKQMLSSNIQEDFNFGLNS